MVDPDDCTHYNLSTSQLEQFMLFSVLVAGKTARVIAQALDRILTEINGHDNPFSAFLSYSQPQLQRMFKRHGIGCHSLKSQAVYDLTRRNFDLRTVGAEDLERVFGIGPKTARFFILHTRRDVRVACLDTHVLKFLGDLGYEVPQSTPGSRKQYRKIENLFIALADKSKMPIAGLDLTIWKAYSRKSESEKKALLSQFRPITKGVKYV